MADLVLWQSEWTPHRPAELAETLERIAAAQRARQWRETTPALLLLPPATGTALHSLDDLLAVLAQPARRLDLCIAGAVDVLKGAGPAFFTVGFVIGNDGELRLASPKRTPELVTGPRDGATLANGSSPEFLVCSTPLGKVAVMPGEDVLSPHFVRAAVFAGAELILNPAVETRDSLLEARRVARVARAWENTCVVATVTAGDGRAGGAAIASSAVIDWIGREQLTEGGGALAFVDIDVDRLRRRRDSIFAVQPLHLRARLFADGYRRLIDRYPGFTAEVPSTPAGWFEESARRLAARNAAPERPSGFVEQYDVILTQTVQKIIQRDTDVVGTRLENIRAALKLAGRLAGNPGSKLAVFGEFFMHGQGGHGYRSPITLQRLAIRYPGPEMELLQDFALRHKIFVAGSSFEIDDRFPGHVFNSAFIIDDAGELIHRYRKIQCADVWGSLPDTTPSSIYRRYLDTYGYDFLFPVANTRIGRLATMVCFDQAHPEVARMLTRHGAEVIIHPSSEGHGANRCGWDAARRSRAFENTAYVLSAMPGGEHFDPDSPDPYTVQMRGYTKLVNFDGSIQGEADTAGPCILTGTVDLRALQRARANPRVNLALWDDPAAYVGAYEAGVGLPNDLWGDDPLQNPYRGFGPLKQVLADYYARGIFTAPERGTGGAQPLPARMYGDGPASAGATRLADQGKIDGEHIQV